VSGPSTINVSGGVVEGELFAYGQSHLNIMGGNAVGEVHAASGSVVTLSGGVTGGTPWSHAVEAERGSTVRIQGGAQADGFVARAGSSVTLVGAQFLIDGEPVTGLANRGDRVSVNIGANSELAGIYADGTPFVFTNRSAQDRDSFATGTLTLEL